MSSTFVLLSSPFLGPAAWQPVAEILAASGELVIVPGMPAEAPSTPDEVLSALLDAIPQDQELILVPHSNAGLYVPAVTTRRRVRASVFVDALLPPASGVIPVAPSALLDLMRTKVDAVGLLPRWTEWWDEADVAGLFPDVVTRRRVAQAQPRVPLSYLEGTLSIPAGWDDRPGAYLAFGGTYAQEQEDASRRGWPVATLSGAHLHMLVAPDQVAAEILALSAASRGGKASS